MRNGGEGSCGGAEVILLFNPTVWAGSGGGGEEGHTQEHTQERTRECCTYPSATYPLKSARPLGKGWGSGQARDSGNRAIRGSRFCAAKVGQTERLS